MLTNFMKQTPVIMPNVSYLFYQFI